MTVSLGPDPAPGDAPGVPARATGVAPSVWLVVAILAALGAYSVLDGLAHGHRHHRAFAVIVGGLLLVPLLGVLVLGRRFVRWAKLAVFATMPALALLVGLELVVRLAGLETFRAPRLGPHPALGRLPVPLQAGFDGWGFRNPTVPRQADVVLVGDSQTYGDGVARGEAYPAVFEAVSGRSTYTLALGGYGPVEYSYLLDQALTLRPRVVVVGLYLGNDVAEAHLSLTRAHWRELRDPGVAYPVVDHAAVAAGGRQNRVVAAGEFLQRHVLLVGWVGHEVRMRLRLERAMADMYWREPGAPRYDEGRRATLFTPQFRSRAMDLGDGDIRDGLRVTRLCLRRMRDRAHAASAPLVVFLLHTKEYYYHRYLQARRDPAAAALAPVARLEENLTAEIEGEARTLGVATATDLDDYVAALAQDRRIFPANADGHPVEDGHRVRGESLWRQLKTLDALR